LKPSVILPIAALCFLLGAALGRWPYGFYVLLRLFVTVAAVYLAYTAAQRRRVFWAWLMGAIALAYNPILPLRMQRSDWQIVNILTCLPLGAFAAVELSNIRQQRTGAHPHN